MIGDVLRRHGAVILFASVLLVCSPSFAVPVDTDDGRLSLAPRTGVATAPATVDAINLRAAILSIHAYVEKNRHPAPLKDILERVDPMPLREAAAILKKDQSEGAEVRRRRMILRLVTWLPNDPQAQGAVEVLVGSTGSARIQEGLVRLRARTPRCDTDLQMATSAVVTEALGRVEPFGSCDDIEVAAATTVDVGDDVGVASTVVAVGSLAATRAGLDAQRWDECSPLWGKAYVVKTRPDGTVEEGANDMPAEGLPITPYGGAYDTKMLGRPFFEHFTCDGGLCDIRLLLSIVTTTPTPPPAYTVSYREPNQWKNFSYPPVDRGAVTVKSEDLPGGTRQRVTVTADKRFGFNRWTNSGLVFLLRRIEMVDYLVHLACCKAP